MTLEEFRMLVAQARKEQPIWFALDSDRPNIVDFNRRDELIGSGFVAVSDPHTGDRYGFKCEGKTCRSEVWVYDHDDREWSRTPFNDLFEFLQQHALAS